MLKKESSVDILLRFDREISKERKGKDKNYYLNCKKTKQKLNWKCKTNLSEGLNKTINFYDAIIKNINSKDTIFNIK